MGEKLNLLSAVVLSSVCSIAGASTTLYDGTQTGLPSQQGWLAYKNVVGTGTQAVTGSGFGPATLDTTLANPVLGPNAEYAGLSNYNYVSTSSSPSLVNSAFPTLSRATGFDLLFNARVDSESHANNDRAGFSVTLLGSDHVGIELGFWAGQVWAQNTNASNPSLDFTHGETSTGFDPTAAFDSYDLKISNSTYTLSANGLPILTGGVRDYSSYPVPAGLPDPYAISNFIFVGDDTNNAAGKTEIESIVIAVPEPGTGLIAFGAAGVALLGWRRKLVR